MLHSRRAPNRSQLPPVPTPVRDVATAPGVAGSRRAGARGFAALRVVAFIHRWLGVALCLLFALWFLSGMVMTFTGYPRLQRSQRLAAAPQLSQATELPAPARLLATAGVVGPFSRVRLGRLGERFVYRLFDGRGRGVLLDAATGARLPCTPELAGSLAAPLLAASNQVTSHRTSPAAPRITTLAQRDQFTAANPAQGLFPLYRLEASDADATEIYVSSRTCEAVQRTTRSSRLLAWLGPIPHWIYPVALRQHVHAWRNVVIWVSSAGILLCVSGLAVGHARLGPLRRRLPGGLRPPLTPYRKPWFKWHHLLGLLFGTFAFSWVFSGLLSMQPLGWSGGRSASPEEVAALQGGPLRHAEFRLGLADAVKSCAGQLALAEIELTQLAGIPHYLCRASDERSVLLRADADAALPFERFTTEQLLHALAAVRRDERPLQVELAVSYDDYHYATHEDPAPPLPYLRVAWPDVAATTHYLDPRSGDVFLRLTQRGRLERWLYNGLHSLDFPLLYRHRSSWHVIILALSACGAALSFTGLVLGVRRIRRRKPRTFHARPS